MRVFPFARIAIAAVALAAGAGAATSSSATERKAVYEGRAYVVDGDTLRIGRDLLRIQGIDAPELRQMCMMGSEPYRCGMEASRALGEMIGRGRVRCEFRDWNPARLAQHEDRAVVQCRVHQVDIGDWMVSRGFAVPYFTSTYRSVGMQACQRGTGIWAGAFTRPSTYRHRAGDLTNDRMGKQSGVSCDRALRSNDRSRL
jgi:endonuclease YncB( thermonuclease family)